MFGPVPCTYLLHAAIRSANTMCDLFFFQIGVKCHRLVYTLDWLCIDLACQEVHHQKQVFKCLKICLYMIYLLSSNIGWKLFQSSATLLGLVPRLLWPVAILRRLFGRSCRLCRIFEAMQLI